jgi:hypothetical protein
MQKEGRPIACLWAVIVDQSFGQVASGYLAKFGYPANR